MTRKQYKRKVMRVYRNLREYAIENNLTIPKMTDRILTPNWGMVITCGKYKGEKIYSYAKAWDMISDTLKGTHAMNGIN